MDNKENVTQEDVGKFLKSLREEKNLTQDELAKKINYSRDVISRIEKGLSMPSHDKVVILAEIYDVTIAEIYAARRLTSGTVGKIEPILDSATVSIKKSYNKKVKILFSVIITSALCLLVFLLYYFFNSYNSIKVYNIYGENDNLKTNEGILVISKDKILFSLSVIADNSLDIDEVYLRYVNSKEDVLVHKSDTLDIYFVDSYGYESHLNYDDIIRNDGKFYIEIKYNGISETIDINIEKVLENNKLFFTKSVKESDDKKNNVKFFLPSKIEKLFTKEDVGYTYKTRTKDKEVNLTYNQNNNELLVLEEDSKYSYSWVYNLEYKILDYELVDNKSLHSLENIYIEINNITSDTKNLYEYFKKNYIDVFLN